MSDEKVVRLADRKQKAVKAPKKGDVVIKVIDGKVVRYVCVD